MIFIANFIFKDLTSITLEFFSARRNSRAIACPACSQMKIHRVRT
jgi:hypothetical protein